MSSRSIRSRNSAQRTDHPEHASDAGSGAAPAHDTLQLRVKPNGRESRLIQQDDGTWTATLKAPPVDGKANAELIALIARHFDVPRSAVEIRAGAGSRLKRVRVQRA